MNFLRSLLEPNITTLNIVLDRSNHIYYAGETITGQVILSMAGAFNSASNGINLTFCGHVKTWAEPKTSHHNVHSNQNKLYDSSYNTKVVINSNSIYTGSNEEYDIFRQMFQFPYAYGSTINAGQHQIPFSFVVPTNAPSTFKYGNRASIRYTINVKLGMKNHEVDVEVCGYPAILSKELYTPIELTNSKKVGLINGKQLTLYCTMAKAGWTLGSEILIDCIIDNFSDKGMTLVATLKQYIKITVQNDTNNHSEKIATSSRHQVNSHIQGSAYRLSIKVPNRLPIIQNTCRTIDVNYCIEVKLDIPFSFNLNCNLPIILTNQLLDDHNPVYPPINVMPQPQPPFYPPLVDPITPSAPVPSAPELEDKNYAEAPPPYGNLYPKLPGNDF